LLQQFFQMREMMKAMRRKPTVGKRRTKAKKKKNRKRR
jgi:signal recognition particle GTPase